MNVRMKKTLYTSWFTALTLVLAVVLPVVSFAAETSLQPPFGEPTEPTYIVATIIQALLGVVGACTMLVFIWGGFQMIFAGGNEERIKKGRTTLMWAVIGLAIILSSYAILQYVFSVFQTATTGPTS